MDINRDFLNLGWPSIEKAGEKYRKDFDFNFVDAVKNVLQLVRVRGLIAYDNTLSKEAVVCSDEEIADR
ncbi:hypothetical protein R1sor_022448 [Riccia sorocarpa]|uniref:Uncharacterized protein n=1 Tax=Riccia sorocarpa TaxID=122646 RepID=A0ABD3GMW3_9MARC